MKEKETFFSKEQEQRIVHAIQSAEKQTSGEIRVHIDWETELSQMDRAKEVFFNLKMNETKERNAVLFHLSIKNKGFSVLGDIGIDQKTPDDFWDNILENMKEFFLKGDFEKGLISGIEKTGEALKEYFPYQKEDTNELSNDISES